MRQGTIFCWRPEVAIVIQQLKEQFEEFKFWAEELDCPMEVEEVIHDDDAPTRFVINCVHNCNGHLVQEINEYQLSILAVALGTQAYVELSLVDVVNKLEKTIEELSHQSATEEMAESAPSLDSLMYALQIMDELEC